MDVTTLGDNVSNAIIYSSLGLFLALGLYAGRNSRKDLELFIKSLYSQSVISLALNFVAVNVGSSLFYSLPELGTIAGVLGVFAYAFSGAFPIILLGIIGPKFREHDSQNWSMSSFIVQRFGNYLNVLYCLICLIFMLLYTVGEMSTIYGVYGLLTTINPLIPLIILAVVTSVYSAFGGVFASLITDAFQSIFAILLIVIMAIAVGVKVKIPAGAIDSIGLLKPTKIGWQSIYILTVALTFSSMFHQGFWQRIFASKNTRELKLSSRLGALMIFLLFMLVGMAGPISAWSGLWIPGGDVPGSNSFFSILAAMPEWVVGIVLVIVTSMACSAMDTLLAATAGTLYDLTYQKLNFIAIRIIMVVFMVPVVILSVKSLDILRIFLLADLIACATVLPILFGLSSRFNYLTEIDALVGGTAGILSIGIFGQIYFGNVSQGWGLLLLQDGLYVSDLSVLGAFLVSPIVSAIFPFLSYFVRFVIYKSLKKEMPVYEIPYRHDYPAEKDGN
ncbi:hypothetical protein BB559_001524 [Furculomyces boomerangus]|uniref:Uncharacterized protein n=1 Tax=Furculomyces boomerangus TaxID=61424 RepID=A0A2T9YCS4_9FUNG|nr:hypothetical protein BB559_004774 [Furculomyces boomerangus]PVU98476.1 hypothetical protein BB559_001524 [Furculomyces boomerangus]